MKKFTFFLVALLMSITSFSQIDIKDFRVTAEKNQTFASSDRFDYQFKIRGDYAYREIKLSVYVNSISSNNLIGHIRWNREGDDYLRFNSYTTKSTWFSSFRSFSTSSLTKFYLVAEYQGNSKTLSYTIPVSDTDGDGVFDSKDKCPRIKGNLPNGCLDSDGDQIEDDIDQCPSQFGFSHTLGCPDSDGDGVADKDDRCRFEYGSDGSGCPIRAFKSLSTQISPYYLYIYNILGQNLINKIIQNRSQEETIKYNLPKGLYFVKSGATTYKFLKN